jgi:hypothetical protein
MPRFRVANMTLDQLVQAASQVVTQTQQPALDEELAHPKTPFTPLGSYAEDFGSLSTEESVASQATR